MHTPPTVYEIRVAGLLGRRWEAWFEGFAIADCTAPDGTSTTALIGPVTDQAALYGAISRLRDLGVTLISVRPLVERGERESR